MAGFLGVFKNSVARVLGKAARSQGLEIRDDSLMVQTVINSGVYYAPQDAAIMALAAVRELALCRRANPPAEISDPRAAIKRFAEARSLFVKDFRVEKSQGFWKVSIAN